MKEIRLSKGYVALVDDEDYEWLSQWKWHAADDSANVYAIRTVNNHEKYSCVRMHRLIMDAPPNMQVDHIDGCGLNNQRNNLRLCTARENKLNRKSYRGSSSKYVGVHLRRGHKETKSGMSYYLTWGASIAHMGTRISIGCYESEEEAAIARDIYAASIFGEFAKLNFPERRDEYAVMGIEYVKSLKPQNSSIYKGVWWWGDRGKWVARCYYKNKSHAAGHYATEIEAAMAHDRKAIELKGITAILNFPDKLNDYLCEINQ